MPFVQLMLCPVFCHYTLQSHFGVRMLKWVIQNIDSWYQCTLLCIVEALFQSTQYVRLNFYTPQSARFFLIIRCVIRKKLLMIKQFVESFFTDCEKLISCNNIRTFFLLLESSPNACLFLTHSRWFEVLLCSSRRMITKCNTSWKAYTDLAVPFIF